MTAQNGHARDAFASRNDRPTPDSRDNYHPTKQHSLPPAKTLSLSRSHASFTLETERLPRPRGAPQRTQ